MKTTLRQLASTSLIVMIAAGTIAAKSVSPKFDGSYAGALTPNAALSTGQCAAIASWGVTIAKGQLQGTAPTGKGSANAIITEEGFVTGRVVMNGKSYPLEGRIADGTLMAGLIAGDCTWVIKLEKKA